MGTSTAAIEHNFDHAVWPLLAVLGLTECGFFIGEDGTGAQKRVGIIEERLKDEPGTSFVAYGLNCGPVKVTSVVQFGDAVRDHGLATALYVVCLIPQVKGAPAIPIVVDANASTFTAAHVRRTTFRILNVIKKTHRSSISAGWRV